MFVPGDFVCCGWNSIPEKNQRENFTVTPFHIKRKHLQHDYDSRKLIAWLFTSNDSLVLAIKSNTNNNIGDIHQKKNEFTDTAYEDVCEAEKNDEQFVGALIRNSNQTICVCVNICEINFEMEH